MTDATTADPWNLRAALAGDEDAWVAIIDEFLVPVWGWARSCGLDRESAEDVAQTVWFKLKDRGHTIEDPSRLAGWLATTTRRESIGAKRRMDRTGLPGLEPELVGANLSDAPGMLTDSDPESVVLVGDLQQRLAAGFQLLSDTCRELLALCWSQLSYEEVATALGKSVGYVGPTRQRCLGRLRVIAAIE